MNNDNDDDELFTDHKLCGYLFAVLQFPNHTKTPPFGTHCSLFSDGAQSVCFNSENGVVLSPIPIPTNHNAEPHTTTKKSGGGKLTKKKTKTSASTRLRKVGVVKGSTCVVQQLHVLTMHCCVKIRARFVCADNDRAVVLVDVYLRTAVWSGWQFPRSLKIATALFKHLSCDWEKRRFMLANDGNGIGECVDMKEMWNVSDCHVLGCKMQCGALDSSSSNKRLFELDEIFKSLPSSVTSRGKDVFSRIEPANVVDDSQPSGIWDLADDMLINILTTLEPLDLGRVASACRHLRFLAASIMPCMKLKLFPHQKVAVEWMLERERSAQVLPHPLYRVFSTEDGFAFYINSVTGHLVSGIAPRIRDFRGGMFCDEPGLGKTITSLSLILKTKGTIAEPPDGVQVIWCNHNGTHRCGYYDFNADNITSKSMSPGKHVNKNKRRKQISSDGFDQVEDLKCFSAKRPRLLQSAERSASSINFSPTSVVKSSVAVNSEPVKPVVRCTRSLSRVKKNLCHTFDEEFAFNKKAKVGKSSASSTKDLNGSRHVHLENEGMFSSQATKSSYKPGKTASNTFVCNENWVQCDACRKWRKLVDASVSDAMSAWFCSMNTDPQHQSCRDPEESSGNCESITYLPGFCKRGTGEAKEENVSFFTSVLKEQYGMIDSRTKKALTWLAKLSPVELFTMEAVGLASPVMVTSVHGGTLGFHKIFKGFGLVKKVEKGITKWYYPPNLDNLEFDSAALRIALCKPLDSVRLYLSRATLIVVPANLVDHWKTQIQKHVRPGQLRVFVWTDHRKPSAHSLAWDYDIVITTFSRLSAEWGPRKKSALVQVHWLRIMLDEGHTLGGSVNLTNKMQMVVSLKASNRWILTGTPTPNTPNSQLSHLQPMLKFLGEEAYGCDHKSWEAGILKPFEAAMEEGRLRLLQLLHRCMISARKIDLKAIPPCIKKVKFIDFAVKHARTYNELVETVCRNILMADWNDPSHVESLLNPKQWKFRSATIRNIRLSCCVAGHIRVTAVGDDIQETMDILVDNGLDSTSEEHALIKYYLLYGGNCLRCNEWCRLPVITPCRHLLCLGCVSLDNEKCTLPGCGHLYEMESPLELARAENPNPKWPVPKDLIELQPSYKQDDWNPDWQSTASSKVSYLVQRLKELQGNNKDNGYFMDNDIDIDMDQKLFCAPRISGLSGLSQQDSFRSGVQSCNTLPEKVLIFSQFLEHIHVIEQQLTIAGIKFATMYSPMHSSNKVKSLAMFQYDDSCMALLMDGSAALGLDLSFVTHVFLMEPIWDRSMEDQVISRAHRMGATRPIHVETLAMRGTIEEQMVKFLQDAGECRRFLNEEMEKADKEGMRTHRTIHDFAESSYLARLSFVRTTSES